MAYATKKAELEIFTNAFSFILKAVANWLISQNRI